MAATRPETRHVLSLCVTFSGQGGSMTSWEREDNRFWTLVSAGFQSQHGPYVQYMIHGVQKEIKRKIYPYDRSTSSYPTFFTG